MNLPKFDPELSVDVRKFCAEIGSDPLLVQGAGGNVSWKDGNALWIKASGTWLENAVKEDIFVPVDLVDLKTAVAKRNFSTSPKVLGDHKLRPSIETLLHALMPHRVVVHVHAVEALSHLVMSDSNSDLGALCGVNIAFTKVKYSKPGGHLAAQVYAVLQEHTGIDVIFLMNHGVVVGGENIIEVRQTLFRITDALATDPIVDSAAYLAGPVEKMFDDYSRVSDAGIQQLALNPVFFNRLQSDWALYPDHVVFLGALAHTYPSWSAFTEQNIDLLPELAFVRGEGVYAKKSFTLAKKAQLRCYFDVMVRQKPGTPLVALKDDQIAELLNWDAEKYRMSIAR